MGRAGRRHPPGNTAGLRALTDLVAAELRLASARVIAEVAGALSVQPAAAGFDPVAHSIEVSADSPTAERFVPGRAARAWGSTAPAPVREPVPEPDLEPGAETGVQPGAEPSAAADVAAQHADTWRLVARAQDGDGEAFGQLYDRYVDVVFRFIYYRVNDRALAEDFTSETFLRALRRITTISYQGRDIGAWFVTIARNIVLDHVKSARHRLEVTTADALEGRLHAPSPEATVLDQITSAGLMAAVERLGAEQRECVVLRFIQGFSVAETAAVMGKNEGAVKALQHRAIRRLAELVGGELR